MEKMQFNYFLIISIWKFSVAMATKPRGRLADLQLFSTGPTQLIFVPNSPTASVFFLRVVIIIVFFNLMLPWKPNKMATKCTNWEGNHQMIITAKYDSHHLTSYEENAI